MLAIADANVPGWATVLAGVASGGLVALVSWRQGRRLIPAQREELKANAEKAAVDIVNTALAVAQERIGTLESKIGELTKRIESLRETIDNAVGDRDRLQARLDLALTERAQLEQQLLQMTKMLGHLDDHVPPEGILIVSLTRKGEISYANDGIFGLFGYAPGELVGKPLGMLIPDNLRELHAKHSASYAKDPHPREMGSGLKLIGRRRDGAEVPVEISLHPTGDSRVIALIKRREEKPAPTARRRARKAPPARSD